MTRASFPGLGPRLRHHHRTMTLDLRSVPLFADLHDDQLAALVAAAERHELPKDHVLFEKGSAPDGLCVLMEGAVSVRDEDDEGFLVRPVAPVGELSVFTGEERRLSAVTAEPSVVLSLSRDRLQSLLEGNGELAFGLMRTLLQHTSRKIARDQRRLREMRANIVSTQKAMKGMQESLLDGEDSPLHAALFEELDALVEQNKRAHYLVEPSRLVPTQVRLDDGVLAWVAAISNEWIYFERPKASKVEAGKEWSGVLLLGGRELPVSGTVERVTAKEVVVFLDELIPDYDAQLAAHLSRARMLDIVL